MKPEKITIEFRPDIEGDPPSKRQWNMVIEKFLRDIPAGISSEELGLSEKEADFMVWLNPSWEIKKEVE